MKKKTNRKTLVIILIVLIIICLACGTLGLLESKKVESPTKQNNNKDYKVTYRYWLDGTEVTEMPTNDEKIENPDPDFEGAVNEIKPYKFEKYTCTNNVIGEFDEEKWEFNPDLTANTTCRLYFLKTTHDVIVKASNGKLPNNTEESIVKVELEKDETINVIPNVGYKFDTVSCNNDALAEYNADTQDLKISNVTKDTICQISFKISDYTAEINVSNGNQPVENKKTANYGGTVEFNVTPSENYAFDKISCTNGQNGNYTDGKVTISGLTNDTVCTVEFRPLKYKVTLELTNGTVSGSKTQEVSEGRNVTFDIKAADGYGYSNAVIDCDAEGKVTNELFTVYGVTKNMTCKVTLKQKATSSTSSDTN